MLQTHRGNLAAMAIGTIFSVSLAVPHVCAQECNPRDFTFEDVERINFSEVVSELGFSLFDSTRRKNGKLALGGQYGQYKGSYDEQRQQFEHQLKVSGYSFDRDTRKSYVRTALSAVGAEMYRDCVTTKTISLVYPKEAYSDKEFDLTVKWLAGETEYKTAPLIISVRNGLN
jgi:hypothetical protein